MAAANEKSVQQHLYFSSCGEEDSSDSSVEDWAPRSVSLRSPSSTCRTPRVQRHHTRSNAVSPAAPTSPIPYTAWRKLRLCDSPSTPKVTLPPLLHFRAMVWRFWDSSYKTQKSVYPRACCPSLHCLTLAVSHVAARGSCAVLLCLPKHLQSMLTLSRQIQCGGTANTTRGRTVEAMGMMMMMGTGNTSFYKQKKSENSWSDVLWLRAGIQHATFTPCRSKETQTSSEDESYFLPSKVWHRHFWNPLYTVYFSARLAQTLAFNVWLMYTLTDVFSRC